MKKRKLTIMHWNGLKWCKEFYYTKPSTKHPKKDKPQLKQKYRCNEDGYLEKINS